MKEPIDPPRCLNTVAAEGMHATMRPTFISTILRNSSVVVAIDGEVSEDGRHDLEGHDVPSDIDRLIIDDPKPEGDRTDDTCAG